MASMKELRDQIDASDKTLASVEQSVRKLREVKRAVVREYNRTYMKHKMRERRGTGDMQTPEMDDARETYSRRITAINVRLVTLAHQKRQAEQTKARAQKAVLAMV